MVVECQAEKTHKVPQSCSPRISSALCRRIVEPPDWEWQTKTPTKPLLAKTQPVIFGPGSGNSYWLCGRLRKCTYLRRLLCRSDTSPVPSIKIMGSNSQGICTSEQFIIRVECGFRTFLAAARP